MYKKTLVLILASALLASCGGGGPAAPQVVLSGESSQIPPANSGATQPPADGGTAGTPVTAAPTRADIDAAWAAILTEVGTPAASTASQCAVVAVGAKACGGPTGYLVYSRQVSDEARLQALVANHAELIRQWNQANHAISDCSMLMPPQSVDVVDGICRAGPK